VITVNGKKQQFQSEQTIQALLLELQLSTTLCAIEVNSVLVPHTQRDACHIQDGDIIEIVSLVGGG
jgi:thiamine biosynthesis protein ThiS